MAPSCRAGAGNCPPGAARTLAGCGRLLGAAASRGARGVVVANLDGDRAAQWEPAGANHHGIQLDVTDHLAVGAAVDLIEIEVGPIDMWYSSAVAIGRDLGTGEDWDTTWRVHVPAQTQFRGPRKCLSGQSRRTRTSTCLVNKWTSPAHRTKITSLNPALPTVRTAYPSEPGHRRTLARQVGAVSRLQDEDQ
jgi:NAD(P)-dependent dehydrogenase (short-subunit alcohol dehydrogenase family)